MSIDDHLERDLFDEVLEDEVIKKIRRSSLPDPVCRQRMLKVQEELKKFVEDVIEAAAFYAHFKHSPRARALLVAYACEDIKNVDSYRVDEDGKVYYRGGYRANVKFERSKGGGIQVYLQPVTPVDYISVTIKIGSKKAELDEN